MVFHSLKMIEYLMTPILGFTLYQRAHLPLAYFLPLCSFLIHCSSDTSKYYELKFFIIKKN